MGMARSFIPADARSGERTGRLDGHSWDINRDSAQTTYGTNALRSAG